MAEPLSGGFDGVATRRIEPERIVIARRVPFVTFMLMSKCGMLFHENYRQLFPASAKALADQARDKTLLGYHDLRSATSQTTG